MRSRARCAARVAEQLPLPSAWRSAGLSARDPRSCILAAHGSTSWCEIPTVIRTALRTVRIRLFSFARPAAYPVVHRVWQPSCPDEDGPRRAATPPSPRPYGAATAPSRTCSKAPYEGAHPNEDLHASHAP
eukprot:9029779-Pyramimonas_sp.AAC.1